jgi:hypothetical protein
MERAGSHGNALEQAMGIFPVRFDLSQRSLVCFV